MCRLIDDCGGIDGDSISRGVGSLVDNRVDGVKRECRDYLAEFAKKHQRREISSIGFWDYALTVKSLLLLARGVSRD